MDKSMDVETDNMIHEEVLRYVSLREGIGVVNPFLGG